MAKDDQVPSWFLLTSAVIAFFTLFTAMILIYLFGTNKSNYAKLMKYICIFEAGYAFSEFVIIFYYHYEDKIFFPGYEYFIFWINEESIFCIILAFYYSMQTFVLLSHNFICMDTILKIRNPIASSKTRLKIYVLITLIASVSVFIILFLTFNTNRYFENFNTLYDLLFISHTCVVINAIIFIMFMLISVISFLFILSRFGKKKGLGKTVRNKFVLSHFIYYLLYLTIIGFYFVSSLLKVFFNYHPYKEFILFHMSIGPIMFFVRLTESNIGDHNEKKGNYVNVKEKDSTLEEAFLDSDQALTVTINKTLNLEFTCCILFGMSSIFNANKAAEFAETHISFTNDNIDSQKLQKIGTGYSLKRNVVLKDFSHVKSHNIIYNTNIQNLDKNVSKSEKELSEVVNEKDNKFIDNDSQDATIIEYCPKVFDELRKLDEITHEELQKSFDPLLNKKNIEKIKESEGKSGSFFFFSHDNKFLIKTLTSSELQTFLGEFCFSYYDHMLNNPDTLLAKIYGVYTIIINDISKIHVILMQNLMIFPSSHLKRIFDLKGSKVDRSTKHIEKVDKFKTLKDLDFLWMSSVEPGLISFTKTIIDELEYRLQSDCGMLSNVKIMDYSIMLIIISFPNSTEEEFNDIISVFGEPRYKNRIFKSQKQKYIYCIGLIDYLQEFNMSKFLENKYKGLLYGEEIKNVSAVDPVMYANRMVDFARDHIFVNNDLTI